MTTYTVVRGDTLWHIATKHGIGLNELLATNPQIVNSARIFPGQTIYIPNTNKSHHTVTTGDTMWHIATKHGIGLNDLMAANPQIKNSFLIFPGQIIHIPTGTNVPNGSNIPNGTGVPNGSNIPNGTGVPNGGSIPNGTDVPNASDDIQALETEVIRLVNAERQKAGRAALSPNNELNRVARIKSQDFINNNYFSHNSPTYGSPFDMLNSFGIPFTAAAENIASGQKTASEVMKSWMNSPGHRANILDSTYNRIGVGVARNSNGNLYWTQMFTKS